MSDTASTKTTTTGRLGTFAGVFTPSVLTILGIILFLRLGYVVGDAGLGQALLVILLANVVSVLTSLSLAAIATNFQVKGGGDYFLISRTLGAQFGGAIGVTLFLAQSISIAFYAIGFAEGISGWITVTWLPPRAIAALAIGPLFLLAWLGADWATRFQYAIMAVLGAAIVVFAVGALQSFDGTTLAANWGPAGELPFWTLFALFFPAVTGFTQGVSMSGELKDPARSLPLGTFLAVGLSMVVYFGVAVLMAGALPGEELVSDYGAMRRIAVWPVVITAGICAATLSSALASFLGAPRILQSLASDRLLPFLNPFAAVQRGSGNPRRAVLFASGIAFLTVALGDLNLIAPVVSMFFLISYGLLNYATFYEANAGSPSFRPRFRLYHKWLSLAGCLACGGMMLAIDPTAGAIAIAVLVAIHQYIGRTVERARWADSTRSALFHRIRRSLYAMNETVVHDRDWRPVILAFTDNPERRESLLRFALWLEGGSGLTTAVRILEGAGAQARRERLAVEQEMAKDLRARELQAFSRVVLTADLRDGYKMLLQAAGIGPIHANVALFHWFDREGVAEEGPAMQSYAEYLRYALRLGCNVVVLGARQRELQALAAGDEQARRIDIWWQGGASSRLSLLLAYLITRAEVWSDTTLRVLVPRELGGEAALVAVQRELDDIRIRATPVLVDGDGWGGLRAATAGAALAFYPFRVREEGPCDASGALLPTSLAGLPPMVLVAAAEELDLGAQPDEGAQGEAARAQDDLEASRKAASKRRAAAEAGREQVERLRHLLAEARSAAAAADELDKLAEELAAAEAAARELARKAAASEARVAGMAAAAEGASKESGPAAAAGPEDEQRPRGQGPSAGGT